MMSFYPTRFYYVTFDCSWGSGNFVTYTTGDFNIAQATREHTSYLKERSPIIVTNWKEITPRQFTEFMDYVGQDKQQAKVKAKQHLKLVPSPETGENVKETSYGPPIQDPPDSA